MVFPGMIIELILNETFFSFLDKVITPSVMSDCGLVTEGFILFSTQLQPEISFKASILTEFLERSSVCIEK